MEYNKSTSNKTGIYRILNLTNNKFYIGSASRKFSTRRTHHLRLLERGLHWNKHLQASYIKYGKEAFIFEIVEICDINICEVREQYYIDTLKPQYNMQQYVGKGRKGMSATDKIKQAASLTHKGKIVSQETRKKMSESRLGISIGKGNLKSQQTKDKISKANKGRVQSSVEKSHRSSTLKQYYIDNPKFPVSKMLDVIKLRFEGYKLKQLMNQFSISKTLLEKILYNQEYRELYNIQGYYEDMKNYDKIDKKKYEQIQY